MFDYRLGLATGIDLPIPELQTTVHPPSILEISYIGEKTFLEGIQLLCINKSMLGDQIILLGENVTNFQIFIQIMNEKQVEPEKKSAVKQVLQLLFPQSQNIIFTPRSIVLNSNDINVIIDEGNFEFFQNLIQQIFCLNKSDQQTFNPGNKKAQEIANKLMKARQKIAQQKEQKGEGSALGQYLSILTIGTHSMSLKEIMNLTMYQLYDLVERYTLYLNWDLDIRSRMAGAKGDKPVDNWMKNIH